MSMKFASNVTFGRLTAAVDRAAFDNFRHAAARIMKDAKASIETSDEPSAPGEPPHTRAQRGHNLRGAIRFSADKAGAVVGPMASVVDEAGRAHEFGQEFRGDMFDERPFMWPALINNLDRFANEWEGSIGE